MLRSHRTLLVTLFLILQACVGHAQQVGPSPEALTSFRQSRDTLPSRGRLAELEAFVRVPCARVLHELIQCVGSTCTEWDRIENLASKLEAEAKKKWKVVKGSSGEAKLDAETSFRSTQNKLNRRLRQLSLMESELNLMVVSVKSCLATLEEEKRGNIGQKILMLARRAKSVGGERYMRRLAAVTEDPRCLKWLFTDAKRSRKVQSRILSVDALGFAHTEDVEAVLVAVLGDDQAVVRSAAIRALQKVGGAIAVGALIERLPKESGKLQDDIVVVLSGLTFQDFHSNHHLWADWWRKNSASWTRPKQAGVARPGDRAKGQKRNQFYGLEFVAESLVYLIDTSGSMNELVSRAGTTGARHEDETKLDRAKRELIKSINGLPSGVMVNVLAYDTDVERYAARMVKLDDTNRRGIIAWAKTLTAEGQTNIYDPLTEILEAANTPSKKTGGERLRLDAILLLTDGRPTAGRIEDPDLLASQIARLNELSRCVIHTIGVGHDHSQTLLKSLAKQSGGTYIRAR